MTALAEIPKRHSSGVIAAGAVDPGPGVSGGRSQVEAADWHAVAKIRKNRAEEKLMVPVSAASPEVTAYQVLVHLLQIVR